MKAKELFKLLKNDGWEVKTQRGSRLKKVRLLYLTTAEISRSSYSTLYSNKQDLSKLRKDVNYEKTR